MANIGELTKISEVEESIDELNRQAEMAEEALTDSGKSGTVII